MERSEAKRNGRMRGRAGGGVIYRRAPVARKYAEGPARPLILPLRFARASLRGPLLLPRGEKVLYAPLIISSL